MAAMAHDHHAVHPSDLEVLDAVSVGHMPRGLQHHQHQHQHHAQGSSRRSSSASSSAASSSSMAHAHAVHNGHGHGPWGDGVGMGQSQQPRRRPLDTLQALRRPPIDPIVLAASLSSGPQVTRHHFLHSFGPKKESKQMARSERLRKEQEDEAREQARLREVEEAQKRSERYTPQSSATSSSFHGGGANGTRPRAGSYANCDADDIAAELLGDLAAVGEASAYRSAQAPRSTRLEAQREVEEKRSALRRQKEAEKAQRQMQRAQAAETQLDHIQDPSRPVLSRLPSAQIQNELAERKSVLKNAREAPVAGTDGTTHLQVSAAPTSVATSSLSSIVRPPPLNVRCYARTRIPTPHGEIFCHLYRNNRDGKEHLALVIDPEQNSAETTTALENGQQSPSSAFIRSRTLDEVWSPSETEMERIVRGAYIGRLSSTVQLASAPSKRRKGEIPSATATQETVPLVRIHSECYTGETIGSQRCDCGEQLDEAIRLIHADERPAKGVVVYLRQEGRGIGLLDKLMAYNLQDMGHDTVSANILLGHLADARKYDIAAEILRDLGMHQCRLLTNNPEKIDALESEGIRVVKRVPMVPRIWRLHDGHHKQRRTPRRNGRRATQKSKNHPSKKSANQDALSRVKKSSAGMESSIISQFDDGVKSVEEGGSPAMNDDDDEASDCTSADESDSSRDSYAEHVQRRSGATMVGGSLTRGPELEKYLRTKVERMGHLLDMPAEEAAEHTKSTAPRQPDQATSSSHPSLAHLTDESGHIPRSTEVGHGHDDHHDAAAPHDESDGGHASAGGSSVSNTAPSSVICATDSAPGTASDAEDAAASHRNGSGGEDEEDDRILVRAHDSRQ